MNGDDLGIKSAIERANSASNPAPKKRKAKKAAAPAATSEIPRESRPADVGEPRRERTAAEMTAEEIDREIREINLETARMTRAQAKQAIQKFSDDEANRKRKSESAQRALRAEAHGKKMTAAQCAHKLGGFGNEDTFSGDDKPSIVITDLPIPGMRLVMCVRCPKEWRSPDPSLKKTNPDLYVEQALEWKEALELIKNSRAKAMGGPTFGFETMDGAPMHPTLV